MTATTFYVRVDTAVYRQVPPEVFCGEWIKSYPSDPKLEKKYEDNIKWNKAGLTLDQLESLWKWKSPQWSKQFSEQSRSMLNGVNEFRVASNPCLKTFWENVAQKISRTGFVYQAFAIHIARPTDYPIVDQHVLRAYICMSGNPPRVVLTPPETHTDCTSFDEFSRRYEPYRRFWFDVMAQLGLSQNILVDNRKLDRAIQAFGKQLREDYSPPNEFELRVA